MLSDFAYLEGNWVCAVLARQDGAIAKEDLRKHNWRDGGHCCAVDLRAYRLGSGVRQRGRVIC